MECRFFLFELLECGLIVEARPEVVMLISKKIRDSLLDENLYLPVGTL
jgi:hypothetical protein